MLRVQTLRFNLGNRSLWLTTARFRWRSPARERSCLEVGVADTASDKADEHLASPWLREFQLLNLERLAELLQHGSADLHGPILVVRRGTARTERSELGVERAALYRRPAAATHRDRRLEERIELERALELGVVDRGGDVRAQPELRA